MSHTLIAQKRIVSPHQAHTSFLYQRDFQEPQGWCNTQPKRTAWRTKPVLDRIQRLCVTIQTMMAVCTLGNTFGSNELWHFLKKSHPIAEKAAQGLSPSSSFSWNRGRHPATVNPEVLPKLMATRVTYINDRLLVGTKWWIGILKENSEIYINKI